MEEDTSKVKMRRKSEMWISDGIQKAREAINGLIFIDNKATVISHMLGLSKKKQVSYFLKNKLKLEVPNTKQDRTAVLSVNDIFGDKLYSVPKSDERKIILDLGANIGVYSLYATLENPNAKVFAFEPDSESYSQLHIFS